MQTLDFVQDNNPGWLLPVLDSIPDYVKSASVITPEITAELSDLSFAGSNRTFPIHSKQATFLSAAYLAHLNKLDSREMDNVKHASQLHGIGQDVENFLINHGAAIKKASAVEAKPAEYALEINGQSYYPVNSVEQAQDSARELVTDFDAGKMPMSWFKSASVKIMEAANKFVMHPNDIIRDVREAGIDREADFEKAALFVQRRKLAGISPEALSIYQDIVKSASTEPEKLEEYMDLLHDMDRDHRIKYSSIQPNPCQLFYNGFSKQEIKRASIDNVIIGGVMVPGYEFNRIKEDDMRMHMGQPHAEFVMDMCKTASVDAAMASEMAAELPPEIHRVVLAHLVA